MFVQEDLDRVQQAIAQGVLEVEHSDGKKVRYRSVQQLIAAADYISSILKGTRGFKKRTVRVSTDRDIGYASNHYGDYYD